MRVRPSTVRFMVAAIAVAGTLAACSGGTATPPNVIASGTAPAASGSAGTTPQANVTESNPAGDIPDTQAFVDFTPPAGGYSVKVPEGWARTDSGGSVLFSDKYNSISIDTAAASVAPSEQSAATELAALGSTTPGFGKGSVTTVQRTAGSAVLITYTADSPVNAVTGKVVSQDVERYEFWNNGRTVTLTLSAPVGSDNVDPWRTVTDSLQWSA
ncbi:MAG: PsbP-related protein [Nakamurella sp.]